MEYLYSVCVVIFTIIVIKLLPILLELLKSPPEVLCHGETKPGWESIQQVFRGVLKDHPRHGTAFAVYYKGEKVVDLYGGYADHAIDVPWKKNTVTQIYSSSKGLGALCLAMLADRGLLDYSKPVSHYWPEFAANGKEDYTVDMLLSYQAGLYAIDGKWSLYDILDNPHKISQQFAQQKPLTKPGQSVYHGITAGVYMNELLKRIDPKHRTLHQFFEEEFVKPLELDICIGLPLTENYRCARSQGSSLTCLEDWWAFFCDNGWKVMWLMMKPKDPFRQTLASLVEPMNFDNPYMRRIPCASMTGYGTARDLAKLYSVLATGERYNGKMLISMETLKPLTEPIIEGKDLMLTLNLPFSRGMSPFKSPLGSRTFGTPGAGGQMVFGDLENELGFAFITNKMYSGLNMESPQYKQLRDEMYNIVNKLK